MKINDTILVNGCITQERYVKGRSLPQLERILGFEKGRLEKGMVVATLIQLPAAHQFQLLGYSQVAEHKAKGSDPKKLDVKKLKELVMTEAFTLSGHKRLVKIIAITPHNTKKDNDEQYPPGQGVPQWKLTTRLPARVKAVVLKGEIYT